LLTTRPAVANDDGTCRGRESVGNVNTANIVVAMGKFEIYRLHGGSFWRSPIAASFRPVGIALIAGAILLGTFMDIAFGEHHSSKGATVCVVRTGKRIEYTLDISSWSVLAKLKLAFDAGDGNLEGYDVLRELVAEVARKVSGPGLFEGRFVCRYSLAQERDNALVLAEDRRNTIGVDCGIVSGWDSNLSVVPRRRNVTVRPVEDGENLAAGGEMRPLRVGACHVGNECTVTSNTRTEKYRKMAGKWSVAVVGDERREAVALDKRCELAGVLNSESGRNIHSNTLQACSHI
jgi:hypothetical protein